LHVHERIDPLTIIEAVRKKELQEQKGLFHWFETKENNPPIREAIEFYRHSQGWSNRLISGDSLLVMNSLLEKEGMAGKVQMIYIDPPYGIKYGSNFQPFINKRAVKDGKDEDLTQEPETIKAFRDTWEMGIHSYLTYLRNRLLLARELLKDSGSCFVQISDENIHHIREIMDEVFGSTNFVALIAFRKKTMPLGAKFIESTNDFIIWYAKQKENMKYHQLYLKKDVEGDTHWDSVELPDGTRRKMTPEEIANHKSLPKGAIVYRLKSLYPVGINRSGLFSFKFKGKTYSPPPGQSWLTNEEGMKRLIKARRIEPYKDGQTIQYVLKLSDYDVSPLTTLWADTSAPTQMRYVVETNTNVISRCVLMSTDPGDLVFDPTCGSGTTAYVSEQWGRRWITCDTSRVAIALAKQRLMTAIFDYYELAFPKEGVSGGFHYTEAPHITLGSIANNEQTQNETLYDRPVIDSSKRRVSGPFTVEAVPSPTVRSFEDVEKALLKPDMSISRSGETLTQNEWIAKLLSSGIRGKGGKVMKFVRIETLAATRWIHAEGETLEGKKAVISFGPEYAPLEQRQIELAIEEAQQLVPKPKIVIFASFEFDPEAAKDIDELKWPGVDVLKAKMDSDLFTSDLKKKPRGEAASFWLLGQPDVEMKKKGSKYVVTVNGFDYYNPQTGEIESGDSSNIAMWELDTNYDGRSLYPRQVFFPMAGKKEGWGTLARNLKAQIDKILIENYRGSNSIPFTLGENKQIAVKIIDDRGIESIRVLRVKE
jgi:adenine-specific DNA-methyltransferase